MFTFMSAGRDRKLAIMSITTSLVGFALMTIRIYLAAEYFNKYS
jgi:hypothetical protein